MNVSAMLKRSLGIQTYTVRRASGTGQYVNGKYQQPTSQTFQIQCSIQKLKPSEVLHLPEGERTKARVKIYTSAELRINDEANQLEADVITINGVDFEIDIVHLWPGTSGFYYCEAQKVNQLAQDGAYGVS